MAGSDKRAKLLSGLVAARGASPPAESPTPEVARSSVIKIADRRPAEDRASEPAPSVLYSKGAATASTFRPSYWSYAHDEQPEPPAETAEIETPAPAPAAPPAAVAVAPRARASRPLPINFVVAFGLVALLMSTTLFVLSQWRRDDAAATAQAALAQTDRAPETAIAIPAPETSLLAKPAPAPTQPVAAAVAIPREAPAEPISSAAAPAIAVPVPPAALSEKPQPKPIAAAPAVAPAAPTAEPAPIPAAVPSPAPALAAAPIPAPVPAPAPATLSAALPAPAPAQPVASQPPAAASPEIETLLARGDELLANGDVVAARLFYQRAAEQGSAAAATAVGQTFDPFFLDQVHVRGARGDVRAAEDWYRKAIAGGDRQAEIRLKRLGAKPPG